MIELTGVSKVHKMGPREVYSLRDINLRIEAGEYVAIMGPSGSGKTTLLQILGGLDTPTEGAICFLGRDFRAMGDRERSIVRRRHIGFVFQNSNLVGSLTAAENIALPMLLDGVPRRKALALAVEGLERIGLGHRAGHDPSQLSGGEMQRVAIVRALSYNPAMVLCDEPTGSLDSTSGGEIRGILRAIPANGSRAVVMVTHDAEAASDADRTIRIKDGREVDIQLKRGHHALSLSRA
jgi:putative ABC transport system ATP-binding protein